MKQYLLSEGFIGGKSVNIDFARYESLAKSKEVISIIWETEEAFTLMVNSFIEFEDYLLRASLELLFQRDLQKDSEAYFDDVRQSVNLRVVGFLTATRMHEEQLYRRASQITKLKAEPIDIKPAFSQEYDEKLEYRVMHALRNHSLHNELPIRGVTFGTVSQSSSGKPKDGSPGRHRVSIIPKIKVKDFCDSDKIKQSIQKEVLELGFKNLDLRFFSRVFLACIARCHERFRELTENALVAALADLKDAHDQLEKAKGDKPSHISVKQLDDDEVVEEHYVDYSRRRRLQELRKYWTGLKWNQLGYVSSEIVQSKDTYPMDHAELWIPK